MASLLSPRMRWTPATSPINWRAVTGHALTADTAAALWSHPRRLPGLFRGEHGARRCGGRLQGRVVVGTPLEVFRLVQGVPARFVEVAVLAAPFLARGRLPAQRASAASRPHGVVRIVIARSHQQTMRGQAWLSDRAQRAQIGGPAPMRRCLGGSAENRCRAPRWWNRNLLPCGQ